MAWVGTSSGATRIENSRWTSFTHLHGLGADWVTSIAAAPDGRVWFGTQGGGLSVFDGRRFTTFDISNSAIPSNMVTAVAVGQNGAIWVGTQTEGVSSFDTAANRWTRYGFPNNSITSAAVDSNGSPWVGTDGAGAFTLSGSIWVHIDVPGSGRVTHLENVPGHGMMVTTRDGGFAFDGLKWLKAEPSPLAIPAGIGMSVPPDEITDAAIDATGNAYFATPRGLAVVSQGAAAPLNPPHPLPVVLVHGWTVSTADDLQDSEFRFLKQYADADGIPVYYAKGISPKNTLFQNATILRDEIMRVRNETGTSKVNLIAFSMGGLNARAYLESSLYQYDVNRVIILGTPQEGVDIWKPILAQQIISKADEPSTIELTPEYATLFNQTLSPRAGVPYDLLIGDARKQPQLDFIADLPPDDGLIGVASALSLDGADVRYTVDDDLHAFEPTAIPFDLSSYLYPADTYVRYLRNALRDATNAPIGSEVSTPTTSPTKGALPARNHTPVVTAPLQAGGSVTRTVTLDTNTHARFIAYFPGGELDFSLVSPDGKEYNSSGNSILDQVSGQAGNGAISLKADIASFLGYSVADAAPGTWSLVLTRKDKGTAPLNVTTYVDLDAPFRLDAVVNEDNILLGTGLTITATVNVPAATLVVNAHIGVPAQAQGKPFTFVDVPLVNRGGGKFSADWIPPLGGYYPVFVSASGPEVQRGTEFVFSVSPGGAKLGNSPAVDVLRDASGHMTSIEIDVPVEARRAGSYILAASLTAASGSTAARLAFPLELSSGAASIPITFTASDLQTPGPYTLDLTLLDSTWAAIQIDATKNAAAIEP